jgi:hypothetical protein
VRLRLFIAGVAAMACLVVPASALAQSLSNDVYSSQGGQVLGAATSGGNNNDQGGPPSSSAAPAAVETTTVEPAPEVAGAEVQSASSASTLPFTGFQAGIVAAVGIVLLGGGALLWRHNRSPRSPVA